MAVAGPVKTVLLDGKCWMSMLVPPAFFTASVEGARHHIAIGALRHHRREIVVALRGGIGDHPLDFVLRQEAEQIGAIARHAFLGREGQHRHAAIARDGRHRRHGWAEQGTDDDLRALGQELGGRCRRIFRPGAFIGGHQKNAAVLGIINCQRRRLHHRGGQGARRRRAAGERQDHPHPHRHLSGAHIGRAGETGIVMIEGMAGHGRGRDHCGDGRGGFWRRRAAIHPGQGRAQGHAKDQKPDRIAPQ